jgi:hypothetical protein
MFTRELRQSGHTRRFVVCEAGAGGWEVREEEDTRLVRHAHYHDWHRVERALAALDRKVAELEDRGWRRLPEC